MALDFQIFPILTSSRNGQAISFTPANSNGGFEEVWGVEKKIRRVPVAAAMDSVTIQGRFSIRMPPSKL